MIKDKNVFPAYYPAEKPTDIDLSPAMERVYDYWAATDDRNNEFFTNFKYSRISGIGKDKSVSRRDASKIIKKDGLYYVWYTRRETDSPPVGMDKATDEIPAVDWDLADIYYATSKDGFDWKEQGIAVARSPKGEYGDRAVTTPDVMHFKGKYYLYYQSFTGKFSPEKGDYCDVSMAWSGSINGPWTKCEKSIVDLGSENDWDGGAIHDPYPLVYQGKIWMFYKGQPIKKGRDCMVRAQGVAIADNPLGPYVKHDLNPILNSGHETCLYPYKEGIAALLIFDGPEKNTVQYAPDGINFEPKASVQLPPIAPGPFCPDAFADNGDGKGISWGLCHMGGNTVSPDSERKMVEHSSFLARFDCDLHRDVDRQYFKNPHDHIGRFGEEVYFQEKMKLESEPKKQIIDESGSLDSNTIL